MTRVNSLYHIRSLAYCTVWRQSWCCLQMRAMHWKQIQSNIVYSINAAQIRGHDIIFGIFFVSSYQRDFIFVVVGCWLKQNSSNSTLCTTWTDSVVVVWKYPCVEFCLGFRNQCKWLTLQHTFYALNVILPIKDNCFVALARSRNNYFTFTSLLLQTF